MELGIHEQSFLVLKRGQHIGQATGLPCQHKIYVHPVAVLPPVVPRLGDPLAVDHSINTGCRTVGYSTKRGSAIF